MDRCKNCGIAAPAHVMRNGLCIKCEKIKKEKDEKRLKRR